MEGTVKQLRVFLTQRCVDTSTRIYTTSQVMIDIMKESTFSGARYNLGSGSSGSIYIKWIASPTVTEHILNTMKSGDRPDLL